MQMFLQIETEVPKVPLNHLLPVIKLISDNLNIFVANLAEVIFQPFIMNPSQKLSKLVNSAAWETTGRGRKEVHSMLGT